MKTLTTFAVLLAGAVAFAYPAVNDKAVHSGSVTAPGGAVTKMSITLEIISQDQASQDFVLRRTDMADGGAAQSTDVPVPATDFVNPQMISDYLTNCAAIGGTLEVVNVPAGASFNTCKMIYQNQNGSSETTWIGDVPFGIVKTLGVDPQGNTYAFELESFVLGK